MRKFLSFDPISRHFSLLNFSKVIIGELGVDDFVAVVFQIGRFERHRRRNASRGEGGLS